MIAALAATVLCVAAWWRGAGPERVLAGLMVVVIAVHQFYHFAAKGAIVYAGLDMGHLVIDLILFVDMAAVALFANRVYPMWMAGAQLIALTSYFYRYLPGPVREEVYDIMATLPFLFQIFVLGLGLGWHIARRRRRGEYRSWCTSAPPHHGS